MKKYFIKTLRMKCIKLAQNTIVAEISASSFLEIGCERDTNFVLQRRVTDGICFFSNHDFFHFFRHETNTFPISHMRQVKNTTKRKKPSKQHPRNQFLSLLVPFGFVVYIDIQFIYELTLLFYVRWLTLAGAWNNNNNDNFFEMDDDNFLFVHFSPNNIFNYRNQIVKTKGGLTEVKGRLK
jgi:hypothetical protein